MNRIAAHSATFLAMLIGSASCDEVKSGLQPGDLATPFEVKDLTGPNKGTTLCYR